MIVWVDRTRAAESIVAQLGAYKTGVEVVTFDEANSQDALHHALDSTAAKGLLFTPQSQNPEGLTRHNMLSNLMPQLERTYLGEELNINGYPHLNHIIQTGHGHLPGINRFKDVAVYTSPNASTYTIPENDPTARCITVLKNGQEHCSYSGS